MIDPVLRKTIDPMYMKYVPKSKREAINEIFRDSDGIWIFLNEGWNADRMDYNCHVIHEDNVKELRYQIAGISKVKED